MPWLQTITPNLDPVVTQPDGKGGRYTLNNWVGWCLAVVQFAFNANYAGSPARVSWTSYTKFRHEDRNIPRGVFVPLWFSGYYNQWHVLIAKLSPDGSGTAWTSPNTAKATMDVVNFSSLDDLVAKLRRGWSYDTNFIGWSEDIGGTRVIEYKEDDVRKINREELKYHYRLLGGYEPSEQELNEIMRKVDAGLEYDDLTEEMKTWFDWRMNFMKYRQIAEKQIADLSTQLAKSNEAISNTKGENSKLVAENGKLLAESAAAAAQLKANEEEQAKSKKAADSFFTNILNNLLDKFGGK